MSDKYAIVSSREELDSLIKDLFGQTNIHHSREKKADRNELTEPLNHDQIDTSDFSEFLDFCYYRSFKLLADSIHNNTSLSTEQRNAALTLSRDLMLFFPIMEHLIVSSLYTVRYLLNDSYMRLDEYVYFNLSLKKGQSFLNNDFLNKYTDIAAAQILENSESSKDKSTKETSCNTIVIHKVKKTTKTKKADKKSIIYALDRCKDIYFDSSFSKSISTLANKSLNSHYKYLFDYEKISEPHGQSFAIRLFMPTYELLFAHLIEDRKRRSEKEGKSTRLPSINHTGIKIPHYQQSGDDSKAYNLPAKKRQKLYRDIQQELSDTEDSYQFMLKKMERDQYYEDPINKILYLYKLNRAFPVLYLQTILSSNYSYNFDKGFILTLSKIPDIVVRCELYAESYHKSRIFGLQDFDKALDCVFPDIENLFFAMLTSKYSLEDLDKHLQSYFEKESEKESEKQTEYTPATNGNVSSKKLFDPTCSLFSSIMDRYNAMKLPFLNLNDTLPTTFDKFVKDFPYMTPEAVYGMYDKLLGNTNPVDYTGLPFTIHNKTDFWIFMNNYLRLPTVNEDDLHRARITNRTELLLAVSEVLNSITGI